MSILPRSFLGVTYYEVRMGVRRWGVWLAFLLATLPSGYSWAEPQFSSANTSVWQMAAAMALALNLLPPVVGGIAMADRFQRDSSLKVDELLRATPLSRTAYVLGKYAGAVLAVLVPLLAIVVLRSTYYVAQGAPVEILPVSLVAFLAVNVPAYAFVGAFSISCTAVLPVRVYQVLFTGYWFWGNFLVPDFLPTLSQTILTPSGRYAASAFFGSVTPLQESKLTIHEGVINLAVLAASAALALLALERFLAWQERRA